MNVPVTSIFAAHEDIHSNSVSQVKFIEPLTDVFLCLFDQRPHRQAINEPARPFWFLKLCSIPQPSKNDASRFAKPVGMLIS